MRLRQLMSIHSSILHLMKHGESMYLGEIKTIDEALSPCKPPPHTLSTLITCITKPLLSLGVNGLHDLTNCSGTHIYSIAQQSKHPKVSAKCKVALNRQAALVNLPPTMDLTAAVMHDILRSKNPTPFTPTAKPTMHTSADLQTPTSLALPILPSPPKQAHLTHQQASIKHPQHKRSPTPNLPPQPIIHTHSLDAAYHIHQPN